MTDARETTTSATPAPVGRQVRKQNPALKLMLEMGPLVLFFIANSKPGLFSPFFAGVLPDGLPFETQQMLTSTAVLMVAVVASLAASWVLIHRLPVMPFVTAVAVVVFGALTFWFQDKLYIQLKPTFVNCLFGATLLVALLFRKPLLPIVLDSVLSLTEAGWRTLTLRWGIFFFFLAGLNELARHFLTWEHWVTFKTFGTMPITIVFALAQVPLILRYELKGDAAERAPDHF